MFIYSFRSLQSMRLTEKNFGINGNGHYFMLTGFPESQIDIPQDVATSDQYGTKLTHEECPESGRYHIHVFHYSKRKKTWQAARDWLQEKFSCKGEVRQLKTLIHAQRAYNYVGKEYTKISEPFLVGTPVPEIISQIGNDGEDEEPESDKKECEVHVFIGPPYTGKTYMAKKLMKEFMEKNDIKQPIFIMQNKNANNQKGRWPGGYKQEPCVLIDEWSETDFHVDFAKSVFDREPCTIATSMGGKSVHWNPKRIFVTTNHISEALDFFNQPWAKGRINSIEEFDEIFQDKIEPPQIITAKDKRLKKELSSKIILNSLTPRKFFDYKRKK